MTIIKSYVAGCLFRSSHRYACDSATAFQGCFVALPTVAKSIVKYQSRLLAPLLDVKRSWEDTVDKYVRCRQGVNASFWQRLSNCTNILNMHTLGVLTQARQTYE